MALEFVLVASTLNSAFPAEYSASWMDTVSAAGIVAVLVGVGGRVEVGITIVGVADGPVAVGKGGVAVRVGVRVGVDVEDGTVVVGVGEASGGASRLISNERTDDQALFIPPAVRARTRHQKRRSLVKVCVVWVCVSPV